MPENDLFRTSLSKAMAICSRREYCSYDIRSKIALWGLGDTDAEKIISILNKENFINELRYATAFVKDKFRYNKWGKIKLSAHLKTKHIQSEIIKSALDSIDNDQYIKAIEEIIYAHKKFIKAKNKYELKSKLLRYGLSKGFESSLLYDLLNEFED